MVYLNDIVYRDTIASHLQVYLPRSDFAASFYSFKNKCAFKTPQHCSHSFKAGLAIPQFLIYCYAISK